MAIELATQLFPHHHLFIANCMASKSLLLYHENRFEKASSNMKESGQILANSLEWVGVKTVIAYSHPPKSLY
jgi:hypothetical protein